MARQNFGNLSTIQKLEVIGKYFEAFNTALKFQSFKRIYVDAFAGSGEFSSVKIQVETTYSKA